MRGQSDAIEAEVIRGRIRQWKAGMEAANRFALERARERTPDERLRDHQAFLASHAQIGMAREAPEDRVHRIPYHELQERFIAGNSRRKLGQ